MKILVAGDRGYIGTVMVPFLQAAGHQVDGLDLGLYEGCDFGPVPPVATGRTGDIRDAEPSGLAGYDAVVCLAALSNDPLGHLNPAATFSVTLNGTMALARAAKQAGVPRFVFASSCSLYGAAGSAAVAEDAELTPVTPYGETKAIAERQLGELAGDSFSPAYLRNATAYGASPRLRLDIVVNNLTAVATTTGQVRMESDGSPWRPLVHVGDICRATEAVLGSKISFADGAGPDLRNYRVDFSKLNDTFPDLELGWTVKAGVDELAAAYIEHGLTHDDFLSSRYVRLRRIRELLDDGVIDDTLRRRGVPVGGH